MSYDFPERDDPAVEQFDYDQFMTGLVERLQRKEKRNGKVDRGQNETHSKLRSPVQTPKETKTPSSTFSLSGLSPFASLVLFVATALLLSAFDAALRWYFLSWWVVYGEKTARSIIRFVKNVWYEDEKEQKCIK